MMKTPFRLYGFALLLTAGMMYVAMPTNVEAWGATGHRLVSGIAAAKLPEELPAFLRSGDALATLRELGPELDRSKDAGDTHDKERDPGHFVDLDDRGAVLGVLPLSALPLTREAYDTALRAHGRTQYQAGYLTHAIIDGWQQIRQDFALWRVDVVGANTATDPADRALFEADRRLREALIIRDVGVWSHYVADGSQPLHVSVHFNGWGDYPNPRGYSTSKTLHAHFEGEFVKRFADWHRITAIMPPYRDCACPIEERTKRYLFTSNSMVVPLYEFEAKGAFKSGDPQAIDFVIQRLVAGAAELRDMMVDAWRASADATVGYPKVSVRDIETKNMVPKNSLFGND